ncbi:MarR family transcriptional regulator [uncultured Roseobacter sp.]|uniref:MarR family winged helix-turn-helix transcriptional regulator n=1 Tax=uncultured Roseobacter sp. TaxID=114847 RepID=UPI0026200368|nr:MarR family transcriptional regulator [uncultured Roseobacter sp.]
MTNLTSQEKLYAGIQMTRPLLRYITSRVETDLKGTGISVGQRAILEVLFAVGKATAPEITRYLDVKRQFVGREVKEMENLGLVDSEPNPNHKSSKIYTLTAKSRPIIESIRAREVTQIGAFAERFSKAEISAFHKIQSALLAEFSPD